MTTEKVSEPLTNFRKAGNIVMFGQNLICCDKGIVKVGNYLTPGKLG